MDSMPAAHEAAMPQKVQRVAVTALLLTAPVAAVGACRVAIATSEPAVRLVFYASQSGRTTLDQDEAGGNPFASALIALLDRPSLNYGELHSDLIALTREKSHGAQVPEASAGAPSTDWILKPIPAAARRVALVFVYSNYRSAGLRPLPGAKRDLERVASALSGAGFDVQTAIDPTRNDLRAALDELSRRSKHAEAAVIYLTGHGFEHGGQVYLLPNDYPPDGGPERLSELAVHVPRLLSSLKAKRANLVFFGGCRTYM